MALNCSARKTPPTTRMMKINSSGVVTVNSAQAARKTELTTALIVIMLRKPKVRMMRAASVFMPMAPTADENVTRPDWNGDRPNPTTIKPGSRNDNARAHRRQPQQRQIKHRRSGSPGVHHVERHRDRPDRHQGCDDGPRQQVEASDRKPEGNSGEPNAGQQQPVEVERLGTVAADRVDVAHRHEDAEQAD